MEWSYLVARFSLNNRSLGKLPKTVSSSFNTQLKLNQLRAFFLAHPEAGAGARARKQAVEQVENNLRWMEENSGVIHDWLAQRTA